MTTVFDVAAYILEQAGSMTAMKLEKLVFYSQAWSLVWDDAPMFAERIEAWANGPVAPSLYAAHRGEYEVHAMPRGSSARLTKVQRETVDAVLKHYGSMSGHELSELTHAEDPWKDARKGLKPGQRGEAEITHAAMAEYYGSLV